STPPPARLFLAPSVPLLPPFPPCLPRPPRCPPSPPAAPTRCWHAPCSAPRPADRVASPSQAATTHSTRPHRRRRHCLWEFCARSAARGG
ncbi:unnamed protein product, partial [Closterium sp. NIES-54]